MFLFLLPSVGYGWSYRGWGPPYPTYIQRRRGQRAATMGGSPAFNHEAWAWRGDFVWAAFLVGMIWLCAALWLR